MDFRFGDYVLYSAPDGSRKVCIIVIDYGDGLYEIADTETNKGYIVHAEDMEQY